MTRPADDDGSRRTGPGHGPGDPRAEGSGPDGGGGTPDLMGTLMEVTTERVAAGGGCVARAPDGRVVFVRHSLPGERVVARVTATTRSFLRADTVEVLAPSPDRVTPPCPHAGPGRCGGCDWQHASLPAQRSMKQHLVEEQLRRVAGLDLSVVVEEAGGSPDGLGWRSRVRFAVDRAGRAGLHRHRSHTVEVVERCAIASPAVTAVGVGSSLWRGAREVEVTASPDGGRPVVAVETGRNRLVSRPVSGAGLVVDGRTRSRPSRVHFDVLGHRFEVGPGVFWQAHPAAAQLLTRCVMEGLTPRPGERAADLYSGAGLFTVPLARAVGPAGSVVAVERNGRASSDALRNTAGLSQVRILRATVDGTLVAGGIGTPDLVVLDPAREGAGRPVMEALTSLVPAPRRIAYVSCDPASFARDLQIALGAGWSLAGLRAFDLFPMTEHVELVGLLDPPSAPGGDQ